MLKALFMVAHAVILAVHPMAMPTTAWAPTKASGAFLARGSVPPGELEGVDDARCETRARLDEITAEANCTLHVLNDQVYEGTLKAVESLDILEDASAFEPAAGDSVAEIGDQMAAFVVDMQDSVPSAQDKIMNTIDTQTGAFSGFSDTLDDSFATAAEKVEACCSTGAQTLARRAGDAWWPFPWGGQKKDEFEQAADAIAAAREKVLKVVEALDGLEKSVVETVTGPVMSKLRAANADFQDKCKTAVDSYSDKLSDVLARQAGKVCTAADPMMSELSSTADKYSQFVGEKIDAAKQSVEKLFALADTLMHKVADARNSAAE